MYDPDAFIPKGTPEQIAQIEEDQKKVNSDSLTRLREEIDMIKLMKGNQRDQMSARVM